MRPGLCSVTFRALPPERVIALAAAAGLQGIEWGADIHVPPGMPEARRIGAMTEAAGLEVVSYGSYLRPPEDGADALAPVLETALALGAPLIRVWPGSRNRPSAAYAEPERQAAAEQIRHFAARAAEAGIAIGLEYHPGTLTDGAASALALLDAAEAPNLHLYWQPRPGLPLAEALAELALLGGRVAHLHVFAWDAAMARYPLDDAAPYWAAVLRALPAPQRWARERFALLEFVADDEPEALRRDARTLCRLLAERG
jgi:sugar phosphate isomerase/epimerase